MKAEQFNIDWKSYITSVTQWFEGFC